MKNKSYNNIHTFIKNKNNEGVEKRRERNGY